MIPDGFARRRIAGGLMLLACGLAQAAEKLNLPKTAAQWRAASARDIDEGYRITLENHPGAVDPHNPDFLPNLNAARVYGLQLAQRVHDGASYSAAIRGFNVRIGDGHAGMGSFAEPKAADERWPGFVAVWRGDGLYVYASEQDQPQAGARVMSCDGKPDQQLMREKLFSFKGRVQEAGQWWSMSRWMFIDDGNPFVSLPRRCVFQRDGAQTELALTWRQTTAQSARWRREAYNGDVLPVGLTEPAPGLFWAAMPTFAPEEADRKAYRAMTSQVAQQRQRMLEADAVVIDLRNNQGGSSTWSKEFASALWGEARVARLQAAYEAGIETWYRYSPGNLAHFEAMARQARRDKETALAAWADGIAAPLRAAGKRGDAFYVRKEAAAPPAAGPAAGQAGDPPAFTRPVYVIVPGQCASACLDALDVFKLFPNTRLIGAPSSADSTYMEVRLQKVRSGLAAVIVPTKVYVNRPRGNGVGYRPDIEVRDISWSTAAFLRVVQQDLAGTK